MKKGFTLIELLAVIVILAIIALIATPIVLNIINDTKESSVLRSAEFYLDAVELSIAQRILDGNTLPDGAFPIMEDGNICIKLGEDECEDIMTVEVSKGAPTSGTIAFGEGKVAGLINLVIDNNYLYMNNEGNIEHMVYTDESCFDFYDDGEYILSGGAYDESCGTNIIMPRMKDNKPVKQIHTLGSVDIDSIILPDTLAYINSDGIYSSKAKMIIMPSSLISIGETGIYFTNVEHVYLNEGLQRIDNGSGITSFKLTKLTIPSTVINLNVSSIKFDLPNLTTIVNRTDRAFDWNSIINGGEELEPFKYGTVTKSDGTVVSIIKG